MARVELVHEDVDGHSAPQRGELRDRGESEELGELVVVDAHDRDVVGHVQPEVARGEVVSVCASVEKATGKLSAVPIPEAVRAAELWDEIRGDMRAEGRRRRKMTSSIVGACGGATDGRPSTCVFVR